MNVPAVILWNLAPCSRPTKCHQLGQQRVYLGLSFLIEETSLLSHKMYPKHKQWEFEVNTERWKEHSGNQRAAHLQETPMQWSQTRQEVQSKAGDTAGCMSPPRGTLLLQHSHVKGSQRQALQAQWGGFSASTAIFSYIKVCVPNPKAAATTQATAKIEDGEKAPVHADSSTCLTMTAETLQRYNCVSVTSGGNGNLRVTAP